MATKRWNKGGATIVGDYRYHLWRSWDDERPRLLWVLLNPSTADGQTDDPTVRRCIDFTCKERYGGLEIVNLFALRTVDPMKLLQVPKCEAIGEDNDHRIMEAAARAKEIVVAWGEKGVYHDRDCAVLALLASHPTQPLLCLDTVSNGCPRHPLRCPSSVPFMPYDSAYTTYPIRRCTT